MPRTGTGSTKLVILRGNSASGKSTIAAEIRAHHSPRDLAIVGQDNMRREVLRERDVPGGANIRLIDLVARYSLDRGFHVIVEGILYADHYGDMLTALRADHQGLTRCYYLDVPFEETLWRHATKPQSAVYGETEMRDWYRERDLLPGTIERVIPASSSLADTVRRIMRDTGLADQPEPLALPGGRPIAGRMGAPHPGGPVALMSTVRGRADGRGRGWRTGCAGPRCGAGGRPEFSADTVATAGVRRLRPAPHCRRVPGAVRTKSI